MILCDILDQNKAPVTFASRHVLRQALTQLDAKGYSAVMGLEAEFQIFERLDSGCSHEQATMPPAAIKTRNTTQGWQFLTEARYGEAEPLLDALRRAAQEMELGLRTVEIEMGPSQFEFTFDPSDPMTQADRFVMFRTMVKDCLLYTSPSPRDATLSRMPSSA